MSDLAVQLYRLGRMDLSLYLYTKLVRKLVEGIACFKSQQKFMKDILAISRNHHNDDMNGVK